MTDKQCNECCGTGYLAINPEGKSLVCNKCCGIGVISEPIEEPDSIDEYKRLRDNQENTEI